MKTVIVFSNNTFQDVDVPDGMDGEEMWYGTLLLHLLHDKGYPRKKAEMIAEAVVYKRLYPGIVYGKQFEQELVDAGF